MKKILLIALTVFLIFIIYILNYDRKVYYVALGDAQAVGLNNYNENVYSYSDYVKEYLEEENSLELFLKDFAENNYRTTDLIRDIKNNRKVNIDGKDKYIQNALIKADLITLSIGFNDLLYSLAINTNHYENINKIINDLDELYKIILSYCKEKVIIIGIYNPYYPNYEETFSHFNSKLRILAKKYDFIYIDIYDYFKNDEELIVYNSIYPTSLGYKKISEEIIKNL